MGGRRALYAKERALARQDGATAKRLLEGRHIPQNWFFDHRQHSNPNHILDMNSPRGVIHPGKRLFSQPPRMLDVEVIRVRHTASLASPAASGKTRANRVLLLSVPPTYRAAGPAKQRWR